MHDRRTPGECIGLLMEGDACPSDGGREVERGPVTGRNVAPGHYNAADGVLLARGSAHHPLLRGFTTPPLPAPR
jgi:hypothetical protein